MFTQNEFGKRLKEFRKRRNLTQKEVATKIGVSEQALSKWENGICLPDVYNLKLLALVLNVSVDCLLDTENETAEKVIEAININGAVFEIVEKPAAILAGKIIYAKDFSDIAAFDSAIEAVMVESEPFDGGVLKDVVLPINDIHLSVNFWLSEESRAYAPIQINSLHSLWQRSNVRYGNCLLTSETILCLPVASKWLKTVHRNWKCLTRSSTRQAMLICL